MRESIWNVTNKKEERRKNRIRMRRRGAEEKRGRINDGGYGGKIQDRTRTGERGRRKTAYSPQTCS